jgi:hypothetical protein
VAQSHPTGYEMINETLALSEMVHALQKQRKDYAANRFEHIARLLVELDAAELWSVLTPGSIGHSSRVLLTRRAADHRDLERSWTAWWNYTFGVGGST